MVAAISNDNRAAGSPAVIDGRQAVVIAPPWTDTSVIRDVLRRLNIAAFSVEDVAAPNTSLPEAIRDAVHRADLVIAVLGDAAADRTNVLFELGFAVMANKRTLLITGSRPDGLGLAGIPYLRAEVTDGDAIGYGLEQFARAARRPHATPDRAAPETRPLGSSVDALLDRIRAAGPAITEAELESVVIDAVRQSGVSAAADRTTDSGREVPRVDLAVWSDDLDPWIDNPLVIEVKRQVASADDVAAVRRALERSIGGRGTSWGLLVYLNADRTLLRPLDETRVLHVSVVALLDSLRALSFGQTMLALRISRLQRS